jgi:hypothetical protein
MKPSTNKFAILVAMSTLFAVPAADAAQPPPQPPPRTAKAAAPVDFTGQWVSVISEDWRWRMVTPLKGDFANIPVTEAARKIGEAWDPAKDEAAGEQCKGYGALAIMREPGRIRISWQDENTLKIETDAGQQTRILHFGDKQPPAGTPATLQGYSIAQWEGPPGGRPIGLALGVSQRGGRASNTLQVTTTNIKPGYLRKNGIPFGEGAKLTEYFDKFEEPDGTEWFVITTLAEDPVYLNAPWLTSLNFKKEKEADRAKWRPTPCSAR